MYRETFCNGYGCIYMWRIKLMQTLHCERRILKHTSSNSNMRVCMCIAMCFWAHSTTTIILSVTYVHDHTLCNDSCTHHIQQMEAKIAFSRLLQTYKVMLPSDYRLVTVQRVMVQTKDDILCVLTPRHKCWTMADCTVYMERLGQCVTFYWWSVKYNGRST